MGEAIIDAWIQHPTGAFLRHEMFASLRRWMKFDVVPDEIPVELTLAALDSAGVTKALASAWPCLLSCDNSWPFSIARPNDRS